MPRRGDRWGAFAFAAFLAASTVGCGGSGDAQPVSPVTTSSSGSVYQGVAGDFPFEVHGNGKVDANVFGETAKVSVGSNKLEINGGQLTVNGKSYGALKSGQKIVVETDGSVSIGGEKK